MIGIKHIRSAPYHPVSNGLAEKVVQSMKQDLTASQKDVRMRFQRLQSFILTYTCRNRSYSKFTISSQADLNYT